ncbi:hypothetical protein [Catellatospora sp. IY07-71]|uniref:hypothetical protein n=1 Tax=Catellatospora sp. IY07-71 TaxID=2728827 RepID=UPI001BB34C58|nr:hypothetical protein [Catellatospora sp. IY07-71]
MSRREDRIRRELGGFLHTYGRRKSGNGLNANDRRYSRRLEDEIKKMPPEDLDRLMRDED